MSSEHAIIVARNDNTGAIELPLGDTTLYDTSGYWADDDGEPGSVSSIIDSVRNQYGEEWTITLYVRSGPSYCGSKKRG